MFTSKIRAPSPRHGTRSSVSGGSKDQRETRASSWRVSVPKVPASTISTSAITVKHTSRAWRRSRRQISPTSEVIYFSSQKENSMGKNTLTAALVAIVPLLFATSAGAADLKVFGGGHFQGSGKGVAEAFS